MADEIRTDLVAGEKNKLDCFCRRCGCKVFRPNAATFVHHEFHLPPHDEPQKGFWSCGMMDFENIGFTHSKDTLKFLTCADCEIEVVGYQDLSNPREMFVAVDLLLYCPKKAAELKQAMPRTDLESMLSNLSPEQLAQMKLPE